MSWAQFKKQYVETEAYLGSDREGIRRLKLLKDEANNLRTELAAAKEEAQLAQSVKDAARERADAAEVALQKSQLEIQVLRQQVGSLMRDLNTVTKPEEVVDAGDGEACSDEEAEIKAVIKALRKRSGACPQMIRKTKKLIVPTPIFLREALSAGWSRDSLWTLGASVALLSGTLGQVVIATEGGFKELITKGKDSGVLRNIVMWYGQHNTSKRAPDAETLARSCKSVFNT